MTTKTAHTAGPWEHDASFPTSIWAHGIWVGSANVETIISLEERAANARLMAAAPEMLEALEAVIEAFDNDVHMPSTYSEARKARVSVGYGEASAIARAKAAIQKARGR